MSARAEVQIGFVKASDSRIPPTVELVIDIEHPVGRRVVATLTAEQFTRALSGSVVEVDGVSFARGNFG